jgi:DNA uptake protein ComE-like DNA-binding protein
MDYKLKQYIRGVIVLIPLIIIIAILCVISRPKPHITTTEDNIEAVSSARHCDTVTPRLHTFDPNEVEYKTLVEMGIDREVAVSLIRWREAGKIFRIKEDVALCYAMTDSLYFAIEPYINIGSKYRFEKKAYIKEQKRDTTSKVYALAPFRIDTATTQYLRTIGFTTRQASLIVRYREMIGGYRTFEEFEECYAVDSVMAERLRPYIIFPPTDSTAHHVPSNERMMVDINSADSATLVKLRGIGAKSAKEIIQYRKLLGGYYNIEQIKELSVVTDENFCIFSQQIYCDSAEIEKIYINFARPKELEVHPYLSNRMLRLIINHRELKGGWSTIEEMIDSKIFNTEEAARIAPYLDFGTPGVETQQPTE